MTTLDELKDSYIESGCSLIEVEPCLEDGEPVRERAILIVESERDQVVVDYGWGGAGFYADVQHFVDGEPIDGTITVIGTTVSVSGRLP